MQAAAAGWTPGRKHLRRAADDQDCPPENHDLLAGLSDDMSTSREPAWTRPKSPGLVRSSRGTMRTAVPTAPMTPSRPTAPVATSRTSRRRGPAAASKGRKPVRSSMPANSCRPSQIARGTMSYSRRDMNTGLRHLARAVRTAMRAGGVHRSPPPPREIACGALIQIPRDHRFGEYLGTWNLSSNSYLAIGHLTSFSGQARTDASNHLSDPPRSVTIDDRSAGGQDEPGHRRKGQRLPALANAFVRCDFEMIGAIT
jgi:hypothetical protein